MERDEIVRDLNVSVASDGLRSGDDPGAATLFDRLADPLRRAALWRRSHRLAVATASGADRAIHAVEVCQEPGR